MARRRTRSSAPVRPRRIIWMLALGVAVLGGTFAAGFSLGQQYPKELVPFFDSHTADAEERVTIVAPTVGEGEPGTEVAPEATPEPGDAPEVPPERSPVAAAPAAPVPAPEPEEAAQPAAPPSERVLAREPEAPTERRAVYVSAGGDGH